MKNKTLPYVILLIATGCFFLPACRHQPIANSSEANGSSYWKKENALRFLVVGDWGRNGEYHQKDVADQMGIEAKNTSAAFVISTGDNFYPDGVISVSDPQWNKSFEDIYSSYSLNIPWYSCFGNHDYRGSIQAQLDYSKISRRWRTTERFYSFERTIPNSTSKVLFVVIDTNPFDRTLNRNSHSDLGKQDTLAQINWLKTTLQNSTADWKIVIGHHPLFTTGVRKGQLQDVRQSLQPIFEEHKVHAYFAGHEHDLQHQKPTGYTHYFVSGAGSEKRPVTKEEPQTKFAASDHGFMSVILQKDTLHLRAINYQGIELYKTYITN
jgi:tartrate-resistant acid phosphatase type 5